MAQRGDRFTSSDERRGLLQRTLQIALLRRLGRLLVRDVAMLVAGLAVVLSVYIFIEVAGDVGAGDTQELDMWALRALRRADDPHVPIGPSWLRDVAVDVTSLGSAVVVTLVTVAVVGFLLLKKMYGYASLVTVSSAGGALLNKLLKAHFARPRPEAVPHLREVFSMSFPSGHAMLSAVVYLTLGALLMPILKNKRERIYCLGVAMLSTLLVGASRVYLGVHYPTDVLAGWVIGLSWALLCWIAARIMAGRAIRAQPPQPTPDAEGAGTRGDTAYSSVSPSRAASGSSTP
jgi:undecaprenyl-diphosphatase